jgi:hypothetical protein
VKQIAVVSKDHLWACPTGIMTGKLPETRARQLHLASPTPTPPPAAWAWLGEELLLRPMVAAESSFRWDEPNGDGKPSSG